MNVSGTRYSLLPIGLLLLSACGGGGGGGGAAPVNSAPSFTSGVAISIQENTTAVMTVTASDAEGNSLTFSLSGGADQSAFTLGSSSGALAFNSAPDFEVPTDANTDNVYEVQVSVTDGPNTVSQTIQVTVTNLVDETAPQVSSVTPANGATGVSVSTSVQGVFNEAIDCATVTSSSFLLVNSGAVPVTGTVSCNSNTATFTPAAQLPVDSYTATLTATITDISGNGLAADFQWGFTTAIWSQLFGTTANEFGFAITTDSANDIYVAGATGGNLDGNTSAGSLDIFVAKYAASGTRQWTRQLGNAGINQALGVAIDSVGNIYVAGSTEGGLDGQPAAGVDDAFVAKYSSAAVKQWTRQLGTISVDKAQAIAIDSADNIYIAGTTSGDLDGNTSAGGSDIFVTKYLADGTRQWTRQLGTVSGDSAYAVAVDSADNVYVTGTTRDALDGQVYAGDSDLFVAKYSSAGVKQWTRQLGTALAEVGNAIAVDSNDNIYVAGTTVGSLDGNTSAGSFDLFVTKYTAAGNRLWTRQLGSNKLDIAYGIAIDSNNHVYVTGDTDGSLDGQASAGTTDYFVVKYASDGTRLWTRQNGTAAIDEGRCVATDSNNNVFVSGQTLGNLDGNINAGGGDFFIVRY